MRLIGGLLLAEWSFPWVLDRQGTDDGEHLVETRVGVRSEQHATESWVDRDARQLATDGCEPRARPLVCVRHGPELGEEADPVTDGARVGSVDEGEGLDRPEFCRCHLEHDRCEARSQDLGVGELGSAQIVVLVVEPDADPGSEAAASAGTLAG